MAQYNFQGSGWCGGWLALSMDTRQELAAAAPAALTEAGLTPVSLTVDADQWDLGARISDNEFSYRLTAIVNTEYPLDVAFATFRATLQTLTGFPVTASNLTRGDPKQADPNADNPLSALVPVLVLAVVAIVGITVLLEKAK